MSARWGRPSPAVRDALRLGRQWRREQTRSGDPCRCGHPRRWHEHFRTGSDCGACGRLACPTFRHFVPARARLAGVVRRAAHRVTGVLS